MRLCLLALLPVMPTAAQQPVTEIIRVDSHVAVPMRDGVKLFADVYRPRREGRFPVLVVRTPYGTQREGAHQAPIFFAEHGYAVVFQDVRGRYESEGAWDPFRAEGPDGADTIEWAARQPWSNGKVATQGGSYLGNVQWLAAAEAPPSLAAAFPAVASTSLYHNWVYFGGAFRLSFNFGWGVVRMPFRIMQPQHWHSAAFTPQEMRYENILWTLPLGTSDLASSNSMVRHYRDWIAHSSYDSYWRAISVEERFDKIRVPVHTFGGYFDIFAAGTINGFTGMRRHGGTPEARKGSRLIIGPWGHGASQKFGEMDFTPAAFRDLHQAELRFYDRHLKGIDNGLDRENPVFLFIMGENRWISAPDWPLPNTRFTDFYLSSGGSANTQRGDGRLGTAKPPGAPQDQYSYDPNHPVPTLGGNNCCGTPTKAGPYDQRPLEERHDVLVYTGDILTKPLTIAGPVRMKLWAATDGPDTDWVVKLIDVHPNGFAMPAAEGILRARFRNGLDRPQPLSPNQAYEFDIDMVGTGITFLPGHRLRVDVTSSHFPQFDRNPNTGEPLGGSARVRTARQTIFHTPDRPSRIVLPVISE
ncbi:MAG: CocE/NonD family hydrolase [Acidobacteria bacterium]|nr:CocE/NonD family hydrolase [Acidobacteriota bacterium]